MMFVIPLLLASTALAQEDIRPLKPALEVLEPTTLWPWWVGALALIALTYAGWRWWRRAEPTPEEQLRRALAAASRAFDEGRPGDGVDACLDALRDLVHDTTDIPARYLTVEELRPRLQDRIPDALFEQIQATLTAWDSLRFAGADLEEAGIPDWIDAFVEALTTPTASSTEAHPNAQPQAAS
ncbi:MAG TPA: hypothetical protein ENK57_05325 [Polyangiaceae bacterium]|nr:hypothetical protein [Polyangiaceae bacterium]